MMALGWDAARGTGDLVVGQTGALLREDGLATSVILSLFLDRRAEADDELPDAPAGVLSPRRGWVGDALAPRHPLLGVLLLVSLIAFKLRRVVAYAPTSQRRFDQIFSLLWGGLTPYHVSAFSSLTSEAILLLLGRHPETREVLWMFLRDIRKFLSID